MFSIDLNKLKNLESFGVSGVLDRSAEVFHTTLFDTQCLGRVSDLLSAQLSKSGLDELRLRGFLLFGLFHAYRSQLSGMSQDKASASVVSDPVIVECGIDERTIAIGFGFNLGMGIFLNTEGFAERIFEEKPLDKFEEMMVLLQEEADNIIFKFQPETRRAELILLMGVGDKRQSKIANKNRRPLRLVVLEAGAVQQAPRPRVYIDMGDMNYSNLLSQSAPKATAEKTTGEFIVPTQQEDNGPEVRVESYTEYDEESVTVGGKNRESDVSQTVKGGKSALVEEAVFIEGDDVGAPILKGAKKIFKNILGRFGKKKKAKDLSLDDEATIVSNLESDPTLVFQGRSESDFLNTDKPSHLNAQIDDDLTRSNENGDGQSLTSLKTGLERLRKDPSQKKNVMWLDGVMKEFIQEKARMNEKIKKMTLDLHTKEQDVNSKEQNLRKKEKTLEHEVSAKDNLIRQKDHVLTKTKEQLRNALKNIEKVKQNAAASSSQELAALQAKYEKLFRQTEEYKRANRQLVDHLGEARKGTPNDGGKDPSQASEASKRVEVAMKLAMTNKKEAEVLRTRVLAMQKEEIRLRMEMDQLKNDLEIEKKKSEKAAA